MEGPNQEAVNDTDLMLRKILDDRELDKYLHVNVFYDHMLDKSDVKKIGIIAKKEDFILDLKFEYMVDAGGPLVRIGKNFTGSINGIEMKQNQIELIINRLEERIKEARPISI